MPAVRTEELSGSLILTNSSGTGLRGRSMNKTPEMIVAWQRHWPEYLLEGTELGLFMLSACLFVVLKPSPGASRLPA